MTTQEWGFYQDLMFLGLLAVVAVCITVGFCVWVRAGMPDLRWPWQKRSEPQDTAE